MPVSDAASRRSYLDTSEKVPKVNVESCCSVSHLCPTLCDSMYCSTPGFSVLHYLQEFAQTHVHWVCDTIQLSHPMLSPSPLAFNLSQILIFFNESSFIIRWPKYWSFNLSISPSNEYSEFISFRIDWFGIWVNSNEVDETGAYYTEWSKSERKTPIQYINAYIWNLERW